MATSIACVHCQLHFRTPEQLEAHQTQPDECAYYRQLGESGALEPAFGAELDALRAGAKLAGVELDHRPCHSCLRYPCDCGPMKPAIVAENERLMRARADALRAVYDALKSLDSNSQARVVLAVLELLDAATFRQVRDAM